MLKRTKAANKSAIEDAIDDDNTAVTLSGPSQPDEDDYGYVSQEASAYYNKLMDKYNNTPVEEPLFPQKMKSVSKDLNSTKDRVRMALLKEEEEESMPHKRKRKSKTKEEDTGDVTQTYLSDTRDLIEEVQEPEKVIVSNNKPVKPRKPLAPPPMDFKELLKLAQTKQFEPVKVEQKRKPDEEELERPMTKKQKLEFLKEQDWKRRREEEARTGRPNQSIHKNTKVSSSKDLLLEQKAVRTSDNRQEERTSGGSNMRIPKVNNNRNDERSNVTEDISRATGNKIRVENNTMNKMIKKVPKMNESDMKETKVQSINNISQSSTMKDRVDDRKRMHDNYSNAAKQNSMRTTDIRKPQVDNSRKSDVSGYNKKLQDSIMSKLQETKERAIDNMKKRKTESEETLSRNIPRSGSTQNGQSSKICKNIDRSVTNVQSSIKTSKISQEVAKTGNPKPRVNGTNSVLSDRNMSNNPPTNVPSSKPRLVPSNETKPKLVPSSSSKPAQMPVSSDRSKAMLFGSKPKPNPVPDKLKQKSTDLGTSKLTNSNTHIKPIAPGTYSKQQPNAISKQLPPNTSSKQLSSNRGSNHLPSTDGRPRQMPPSGIRPKQFPPSDVRPKQLPPSDVRPKQLPPSDVRPKQLPPSDMQPKRFPPADVRPKQFPPPDVRSRQFPPPDVRSKQFPPSEVRKKPKLPVKRRITDSDEEYDSEMDDFIDDGPEEDEDYSQHIREIFGYDKRKYTAVIEDDECMESNFAQQLKEEFISTKIGILEDLEDIKQEQMEKKRKAMKKKK